MKKLNLLKQFKITFLVLSLLHLPVITSAQGHITPFQAPHTVNPYGFNYGTGTFLERYFSLTTDKTTLFGLNPNNEFDFNGNDDDPFREFEVDFVLPPDEIYRNIMQNSSAFSPDSSAFSTNPTITLSQNPEDRYRGDLFLDGPFKTAAVQSMKLSRNPNFVYSCLNSYDDPSPIRSSTEDLINGISNYVYANPNTLCQRKYTIDRNGDGVISNTPGNKELNNVDDGVFCNCVFNKTTSAREGNLYQKMDENFASSICKSMTTQRLAKDAIKDMKRLQLVSRLMNVLSVDPVIEQRIEAAGANCNPEALKNFNSFFDATDSSGNRFCPEKFADTFQDALEGNIQNCISASGDTSKCNQEIAMMDPVCMQSNPPASCFSEQVRSSGADCSGANRTKCMEKSFYEKRKIGDSGYETSDLNVDYLNERVTSLSNSYRNYQGGDAEFNFYNFFSDSIYMVSGNDLCYDDDCSQATGVKKFGDVFDTLSAEINAHPDYQLARFLEEAANAEEAQSMLANAKDEYFKSKVSSMVTRLYEANKSDFKNMGLNFDDIINVGSANNDSAGILNSVTQLAVEVCHRETDRARLICAKAMTDENYNSNFNPRSYGDENPLALINSEETRDKIVENAIDNFLESGLANGISSDRKKAMSDMLYCNTLLNQKSSVYASGLFNEGNWYDDFVKSGRVSGWYMTNSARNKVLSGEHPLYKCNADLVDEPTRQRTLVNYNEIMTCMNKEVSESYKDCLSSDDGGDGPDGGNVNPLVDVLNDESNKTNEEVGRIRANDPSTQHGNGYGGREYTGGGGGSSSTNTKLAEEVGTFTRGATETINSIAGEGSRRRVRRSGAYTDSGPTTTMGTLTETFNSMAAQEISGDSGYGSSSYRPQPGANFTSSENEGIIQGNELADNTVQENASNDAALAQLRALIESQNSELSRLRSEYEDLKTKKDNGENLSANQEQKLSSLPNDIEKQEAMLATLNSRAEGLANTDPASQREIERERRRIERGRYERERERQRERIARSSGTGANPGSTTSPLSSGTSSPVATSSGGGATTGSGSSFNGDSDSNSNGVSNNTGVSSEVSLVLTISSSASASEVLSQVIPQLANGGVVAVRDENGVETRYTMREGQLFKIVEEGEQEKLVAISENGEEIPQEDLEKNTDNNRSIASVPEVEPEVEEEAPKDRSILSWDFVGEFFDMNSNPSK